MVNYSSHLESFNAGLLSGWSPTSTGGISSPSGWSSSWFAQAWYSIRQLENSVSPLQSGWSYSDSAISAPPGSSSSSWFYRVLQAVKDSYYKLSSIDVNTGSLHQGLLGISQTLSTISGDLSDLTDIFASPADVALKASNESTVSAVNTEYFSGSGGSEQSIKASNTELGDFKGLGVLFRRFDSGYNIYSATSLFDPDNDQFGLFSWLTQENAEALNPLYAPPRRGSSDPFPGHEEIVTDFVSEHMQAMEDWKEREG